MKKEKKVRLRLAVALVIVVVLAALFAVVLQGSRQSPAEYAELEPAKLIVAADLHYLAPQLTDGGEYFQRMARNADGKALPRCEEITDAFLDAVIAEKPDALILAGDLTFNGAVESHTALAEKLYRVQAAGVPVLVLPGNHDMNTGKAVRFEGDGYLPVEDASAAEFADIYSAFGYGTAAVRDAHSLSYVVQLKPGLRVLLVDVNTEAAPGKLTGRTLRWVKKQLQAAQQAGDRVIAVSHQNLLAHNSLLIDGYRMENADKLLELYEEYGVLANLSGHIHLQHTAESAAGLPELVTSSLLVSPNQYGVLTVGGGTLEYTTASADPPELAEYSRTFFWESAYRKAFNAVGYPDVRHKMASFYADANTAYFSGRMSTLQWDAEALALWQKEPSFITHYLESMAEETFADHTAYSRSIP